MTAMKSFPDEFMVMITILNAYLNQHGVPSVNRAPIRVKKNDKAG